MSDACCDHGLCTKKALPGRPRCREHQVCQTPGCPVKKANYQDFNGTWHCSKHAQELDAARDIDLGDDDPDACSAGE
jgi:hypothetical protein